MMSCEKKKNLLKKCENNYGRVSGRKINKKKKKKKKKKNKNIIPS